MNDLLTHWPITSAARRLFLLLLLAGFSRLLQAQCSLVCNEDIQVSLDPAGHALITTQMIAPNASSTCPGLLELTLYNHLGQPLANPLSCASIGETVTARVRHLATGNFCTGTIELSDAIAPVITCPEAYIFCHEDPAPGPIAIPVPTDNCTASNAIDLSHFDQETDLGCGVFQLGFPVLRRIDRTWIATDESGNSASCVQRIWLKHIRLQDIVFPANCDNISTPALSCGEDPENLERTGQPAVAGLPVGISIDCELAVTYTDNVINNCPPASFTVLRTWTAIDFCTSGISSRIQIIKVEDKTPPVLTAPEETVAGTDPFSCTGTVMLPDASATDNCSSFNIVPHWAYGNGYGPFSGVPMGEHIVTYVATDACGNTSSATMLLRVEDTTPPLAVCSSNLQISVSANGQALLNAGTIGNNSSDNCGPVFFAISRDGENYTSQLLFTCDDIGQPLTVTLQVTDAAGLQNYCESEISVRDFLKPNITCPAAVTLTCLQSFEDLSLTGQAVASDNCAMDTIFYQDQVSISACRIGSVSRSWKALDAGGNLKSCLQVITLAAVQLQGVSFPGNVTLLHCASPASLHPDTTGWPVANGQSCSPVSMNFQDEVFTGLPGFCRRVLRHWKVVDQCVYESSNGAAGIWEQTQTIDIQDVEAPELSLPADVTVAVQPDGCTGQVILADAQASDCNGPVIFSHDSPFAASGANASGWYPMGTHSVSFTATDLCGNTATASFQVTVLDQTPPVARCFTGVTATIEPGGTANLQPVWFDGGSTDNCTLNGTLQFTVTPALFDCQQLGFQSVTFTVADASGNVSSCTTDVLIKDNAHLCGLGNPGFMVDGIIRTPTGAALRDIPVQISGATFNETIVSDSSGYFIFDDVPAADSLMMGPVNNAKWLNGITTFDLVQISKHILGIAPLGSPEKMICADANRSRSITTADIVQFRKLILGIFDTLPGNTSWRFVDANFVYPDPLNPFSTPFPETILLDSLNGNRPGSNFKALKIGDVNDSVDPANARNAVETLGLFIDFQKDTIDGKGIVMTLKLPDWSRLEGFQFELEFDTTQLKMKSLGFSQPSILDDRHAVLKSGNRLAVSWDGTGAGPLHGSELLELKGQVLSGSDPFAAIKICLKRLAPEAYLLDGESWASLDLRRSNQIETTRGTLLHLYPNPAPQKCLVENPFPGQAGNVRMVDARGVTVWQQKGYVAPLVTIETQSLLPGIYLVEWTAGNGRAMGRLVVLKRDER